MINHSLINFTKLKSRLIVLLWCFLLSGLISCEQTERKQKQVSDIVPPSESVQVSNTAPTSESEQTEQEPVEEPLSPEILALGIPRYELGVSLFDGFPTYPEYFTENNVPVKIEQDDGESSKLPNYYGVKKVYIRGDNYLMIYSNDDGYRLESRY